MTQYVLKSSHAKLIHCINLIKVTGLTVTGLTVTGIGLTFIWCSMLKFVKPQSEFNADISFFFIYSLLSFISCIISTVKVTWLKFSATDNFFFDL